MIRTVLTCTLVIAAGLAGPALAEDHPAKKPQSPRLTVAYFSTLQELPAATPEEMAKREQEADGDADGIAAAKLLNDWKLCVADALQRWAPLKPGPGTLIDGAYGRCADVELDYRTHLMRISQDGRIVMDIQMAKTMTRTLEDIWRPRLTALALDQELAAQGLPAVK